MGIEAYPKVRVTTDIVILTVSDLPNRKQRSLPDKCVQVMLIKRDNEPFKGKWTLPGGFVDFNKPLIKTIHEKLEQKTGANNLYVEQLYTYGDDVYRDPRDRVISVGYIALVNEKQARELQLANGNSETEWFWVHPIRDKSSNNVIDIRLVGVTSGVEITELGFDHKTMVIDSLNRIGNKIMYTDIGFNLVNKEFTVGELRLAFETLAGHEIPGFRRIITPKIREVGLSTKDVRSVPDYYRPSKLYTKIGG